MLVKQKLPKLSLRKSNFICGNRLSSFRTMKNLTQFVPCVNNSLRKAAKCVNIVGFLIVLKSFMKGDFCLIHCHSLAQELSFELVNINLKLFDYEINIIYSITISNILFIFVCSNALYFFVKYKANLDSTSIILRHRISLRLYLYSN